MPNSLHHYNLISLYYPAVPKIHLNNLRSTKYLKYNFYPQSLAFHYYSFIYNILLIITVLQLSFFCVFQ